MFLCSFFVVCVFFLCFVFHSWTARLRSPVHVGGGYFLFEFDDNKTKTQKKNSKDDTTALCLFASSASCAPHPYK